MESQIQRVVEQICEHVTSDTSLQVIGIGGDVRFAANHLLSGWHSGELGELSVDGLNDFARQMLRMSDDEIVQRYGVSFQDAETHWTGLVELRAVGSWISFGHAAYRRYELARRPCSETWLCAICDCRFSQSDCAVSH